jgi:hypothetical protein
LYFGNHHHQLIDLLLQEFQLFIAAVQCVAQRILQGVRDFFSELRRRISILIRAQRLERSGRDLD